MMLTSPKGYQPQHMVIAKDASSSDSDSESVSMLTPIQYLSLTAHHHEQMLITTNGHDTSQYQPIQPCESICEETSISTNKSLISPYNSKQRLLQMCDNGVVWCARLICSSWCIILVWMMFIGAVSGSYLLIHALNIPKNGYPIHPALFIGILTLLGLFAFGCCVICTWLGIDSLLDVKKECNFLSVCCDHLKGRDKHQYYTNEWNEHFSECNKIDYVINYYCRKYHCHFDDDLFQMIYDYNGHDYIAMDESKSLKSIPMPDKFYKLQSSSVSHRKVCSV
eukprot:192378_1